MSLSPSSIASFFLIIFLGITISCQSPVNPNKPKSYIGKSLRLNHELNQICAGNKTIIIYYDFRDCFSCQKKELVLWDDFITAVYSSVDSQNSIKIVFVVNVANDDHKSSFLEDISIDYPVDIFFDSEGVFSSSNVLPTLNQYNCFLLDENGRIKLIGKPIFNTVLFDKYISKINSEHNS